LQRQQRCWKYFQLINVVSFVVKIGIAAVFGLLLTSSACNTELGATQGQTRSGNTCSRSDQTYTMGYADTPRSITERYDIVWTKLALYNSSVQPDLLYPDEVICDHTGRPDNTTSAASVYSLPTGDNLASLMQAHVIDTVTHGQPVQPANVMRGAILPVRQSSRLAIRQTNVFPYGQCTWYANERYHQLHGTYVPWRTQANAWQWRARATEFGWHVSVRPIIGSILVLQPSVQGASRLGHVAVVEWMNRDGSFIASSMNWGARRAAVTQWKFFPGPGVSFISR